VSHPFPARYDGVCAAGCENRIHPGDIVRYEDDRLVHDECAPRPDPLDLRPSGGRLRHLLAGEALPM